MGFNPPDYVLTLPLTCTSPYGLQHYDNVLAQIKGGSVCIRIEVQFLADKFFWGVRAIPFLSLMPKRFLDLAQDFVLIEGTVPIIFATMHLEMVQDAFLAPHMDPKVTQKETLGENG